MQSMSHDWRDADQLCKDLGMHLITLEHEAENTWLNTYLKQSGLDDSAAKTGLWLGYQGDC